MVSFKNSIIEQDMDYIFNQLNKTELEFFNDSEIFVTGGAGFIGHYLVSFFHRYFDDIGISKVVVADNFILGRPTWLENISEMNKNIIPIQMDVANAKIDEALSNYNINIIFHLASIASPSYYRMHPLNTIDANVWGLRHLLDYFSQKGIRGFLNFSSSEVYGDPDPKFVPTNEEYHGNVAFNGPRACYDEAKRFGETLCYVFNKEYGMNITSVRPFNNYGPGMKLNDKRAPPDFASAVLEGRPITIFSNGDPKRTFCYIADAVVGYLKAIAYGKFNNFNIGMDKHEISISDLAKLFADAGKKIFGYETEIIYHDSNDVDYLKDNPQRRCPDIGKAKELLNFNPTVEVSQGVKRFLSFLKEEQEI